MTKENDIFEQFWARYTIGKPSLADGYIKERTREISIKSQQQAKKEERERIIRLLRKIKKEHTYYGMEDFVKEIRKKS